MSTTRTFKISHSEFTQAAPAKIWALWHDVNNWPQWDLGLEACALEQPFAAGSTFLLKPRGADQALTAELQVVEENHRFADITRLPFGTIQAIHEVQANGGGARVTHTIVAEIAEDKAEFFATVIWPNMEHGLAPSVKKLTEIAAAS